MIYSKNEAFLNKSYRYPDDVKYHEKFCFLNKSYFNKIYIVLVLSFTYMAFDIFMKYCIVYAICQRN